ncbi:MAG: molybdopterin dinucleotide binding domain-containing protein, partial [Dehalococcoidia bacterium]
GRTYASQGTYTTGDFRAQVLEAAVKPEGEAVPMFAALGALAEALGVTVPANPDAALGELAKANPEYLAAWDLIVGEGVKLAVQGSGRGTIVPVDEVRVAGDGLRVITSRDLYTSADAAALRHPEAEKLHRYDRIQVSEGDATRLGISTEDEVEVSAGWTTIRARATVTDRVPEGAVYVSSLLQGGAVAALFANGGMATVRLGALVPA